MNTSLTFPYLAGVIAGIGLGVTLAPALMKRFDLGSSDIFVLGSSLLLVSFTLQYFYEKRAKTEESKNKNRAKAD